MNRTWRIITLLSCAQIGAIGYFLIATQKLGNAHGVASPNPRAGAAPQPQQLALLQKENARLRADLEKIPTLQAEAKRLENVLSARESEEVAFWTVHSNRLQQAMLETRQQIKAFKDWSDDHYRMELRERANARLAAKAAEKNKTPEQVAQEYQQLDRALEQISLQVKRMAEFRRDWAKIEKTPENRDRHVSQMGAAWTASEASRKQIGDDMVLFEELAVSEKNLDSPRTPVLRSIVPDLRGLSVTVYLDGSVEWSGGQR